MVCIYCGGKTQVTNSRHQKRLNHNWRRRECYDCHAVFTTEEAAELGTSLVVKRSSSVAQHMRSSAASGAARGTAAPSQRHSPIHPFSRDKLFVSILRAVGHRTNPINDAGALTATIVAQLVRDSPTAAISPAEIITATLAALQNFDAAAAVQYRAYHKS